MKRAREERGVSLRHIAEVTKISVTALEALERNDISRLPGGIFSRSFVRSYAIEIGLDPEQTVREFLARFPDDSLTAGSRHAPPDHDLNPDEPRRRRLSGVLITVSRVPSWNPASGRRSSTSFAGATSRTTSASSPPRAPWHRVPPSSSGC
jgi:transcriptional regulator with XRE-family HTH domain